MGISGSVPRGDEPTETQSEKVENNTKYNPDFTARVIAATGPNANPRLKQIMPSLLRHLHDFAREVDLTIVELMAGVELINEAGRMSTDRRNETQLICDILGLESLVDEITSKLPLRTNSSENNNNNNNNSAETTTTTVTPSTILGPFYRTSSPRLANGASILLAPPPPDPSSSSSSQEAAAWYAAARGLRARIAARVLSARTREPVAGARVDVWQAAPNGLYEQQDPAQPEMNLRGRFVADGEGRVVVYALRPTPYAIPRDGPAGRVLGLLDRRPWRPAHLHFLVEGPAEEEEGKEKEKGRGFAPLTTQLFDAEDPLVRDDAVFAVREDLLVRFEERLGDEAARWQLQYDFLLREC